MRGPPTSAADHRGRAARRVALDHPHAKARRAAPGSRAPAPCSGWAAAYVDAELLVAARAPAPRRRSRPGRSCRRETPSARPCVCRPAARAISTRPLRRIAPPRRRERKAFAQPAVTRRSTARRGSACTSCPSRTGMARCARPCARCARRCPAARRGGGKGCGAIACTPAGRPAADAPLRRTGSGVSPAVGREQRSRLGMLRLQARIRRWRRSSSSRSISSCVRTSILRQQRDRFELHAVEHRREQLEGLALVLEA